MTPPTHPGGPGGQRDQEHWVVQHVQGEGYQPPITSTSTSYMIREKNINNPENPSFDL